MALCSVDDYKSWTEGKADAQQDDNKTIYVYAVKYEGEAIYYFTTGNV